MLAAGVGSYIAVTLVVAALALTVLAGAVTALKGRWGLFFLGFIIAPLWFVGAIRPGKPYSYWTQKGW